MIPAKRPSWYLYVLLQNRWLIVGFVLMVMVPTVVITYLLEEKYTVTTTIMPPEERTTPALSIGGLGVSEFAGYFSGGMGFSLPLMTTLSDVYLEVLQSRSLADNVIRTTAYLDSTGLREKYGHDETLMMYWARKRFNKNYSASVTPAGFLEIDVTTSSPMYSVRLSDRVVAVLDSTVNEIYSSRASSNRRFLERQIARVDSIRSVAADSLRVFERQHGVVALEAELTAFVSNLADLKSDYLRAAARAQALRNALGGPTTASRELDLRAQSLMDVIDMLEKGEVPAGYEEMETGFTLSEVPDMQFRYIRHQSTFETAQKMSSMLALNYQQAVLEETRSESNVRLLDPPMHPGWKSKPKKLLIWIEVFLVSLLFIVAYVLVRERIRQLRREKPEVWSRWAELGEDIRSDLTFWRGKRGNR